VEAQGVSTKLGKLAVLVCVQITRFEYTTS
jgi:hypothetical protein